MDHVRWLFFVQRWGEGGTKGRLSRYVEIFWNKKDFSLLYKTNRFHVAVRLFSNRSQMTSKCGKNISDTIGYASCATFLFLPHIDVVCDLLLNRRTATWNLFVKLTNIGVITNIRYINTIRCFSILYLTNRFHVAVRLFSNRSQMTSKCGKNKKVAHEA